MSFPVISSRLPAKVSFLEFSYLNLVHIESTRNQWSSCGCSGLVFALMVRNGKALFSFHMFMLLIHCADKWNGRYEISGGWAWTCVQIRKVQPVWCFWILNTMLIIALLNSFYVIQMQHSAPTAIFGSFTIQLFQKRDKGFP